MDEKNNTSTESWKNELQKHIIRYMTGEETGEATSYMGYAYMCLAPSSIYKYFPDSMSKLMDVQNNVMWYSVPNKFNDVFDTDFIIDKEAVFVNFLKQASNGTEIRTGSKVWKDLRGTTTRAITNMEKAMKQIRQSMGVSCFSESADSLIMWAHYANYHKGMCVEYELMGFNSNLKFTPVPVIYQQKRPCLQMIHFENSDKDATQFYINGLTTKSDVWSDEKEWRIIRDKGACGEAWDETKQGALLQSITPSSIILGCEASGEFEAAVKDYCESSSINLFKMRKDNLEYQLIKEPILQFDT